MTRIAICVATCRRPDRLAELLTSLAALHPVPGVETAVVVVDNDPDRSATPVLATAPPSLKIVVGHEPSPGYSSVRNATVSLAGDVDYLAFVDDDETVPPDWLGQLLSASQRFGADVVVGRMEYAPHDVARAPRWVRASSLVEFPDAPDGAAPPVVWTCNLLVRRTCLDGLDPPFDRRFDRTSAEDTFLGEMLRIRGATMVFAPSAVAYEALPADRWTSRWWFARGLRNGGTHSVITVDLGGARAPRALRAAARLVSGTVRMIAGFACRDRALRVRGSHQIGLGIGGLSGLVRRVPMYSGATTWHLVHFPSYDVDMDAQGT